MGSSSSVIGRPSMSPSGMPVSAMNRSEIQVRRPSASVSKIQSELASATSRNRSSLSTMAEVEVRLCRSADQPKATNSSSATPERGARAIRYSVPGRRGCQRHAADRRVPSGPRSTHPRRRRLGRAALKVSSSRFERAAELRQPSSGQAAHDDQHVAALGRRRGPAQLSSATIAVAEAMPSCAPRIGTKACTACGSSSLTAARRALDQSGASARCRARWRCPARRSRPRARRGRSSRPARSRTPSHIRACRRGTSRGAASAQSRSCRSWIASTASFHQA